MKFSDQTSGLHERQRVLFLWMVVCEWPVETSFQKGAWHPALSFYVDIQVQLQRVYLHADTCVHACRNAHVHAGCLDRFLLRVRGLGRS